jgi:hypothetical protein
VNEHELNPERCWEQDWAGHELAQMRRMARMPLSEKLAWLEEAHRLVEQMRHQHHGPTRPTRSPEIIPE